MFSGIPPMIWWQIFSPRLSLMRSISSSAKVWVCGQTRVGVSEVVYRGRVCLHLLGADTLQCHGSFRPPSFLGRIFPRSFRARPYLSLLYFSFPSVAISLAGRLRSCASCALLARETGYIALSKPAGVAIPASGLLKDFHCRHVLSSVSSVMWIIRGMFYHFI